MCLHVNDEAERLGLANEARRLALAMEASRKVAMLETHYRGLAAAGAWPSDRELADMPIMAQWVAFAVKSGQNPEDVVSELAGYLEAEADMSTVTYPALMARRGK